MADVVLPHTITAGTEMVAADVQGNDVALRDAINNDVLPLIEGTREVFGWVAADGSVAASGSGNWSVTKTDVGIYSVTFSGLSVSGSNVYPIVTPVAAATQRSCNINGVANTGFIYSVDDGAGNRIDNAAFFRCIVKVVS